jgi:hypothetical protein
MSYEGTAATGIPLISQGTGNKPKFGTMAVSGGGTNATSFATNNGVVRYTSATTSLVTSSSMQIDSSDIITNTLQPCFLAYNANAVANATGDSTLYSPCQFDTVVFDNTSSFSGNRFTAPVLGRYLICAGISISNIGAAHTQVQMRIATSSGFLGYFLFANPTVMDDGGTLKYSGSMVVSIAASAVCSIQLIVAGSTKTITWNGAAITASPPYYSGYLLC